MLGFIEQQTIREKYKEQEKRAIKEYIANRGALGIRQLKERSALSREQKAEYTAFVVEHKPLREENFYEFISMRRALGIRLTRERSALARKQKAEYTAFVKKYQALRAKLRSDLKAGLAGR